MPFEARALADGLANALGWYLRCAESKIFAVPLGSASFLIMPRPLLRLAQGLLVLAAFCLINGADFIAQSVAWSTMILDYSSGDTVAAAVVKTFDGTHSCRLCQEVSRQQGSEQRKIAETDLQKLHLCCFSDDAFDWGAPARAEFAPFKAKEERMVFQPPFPPPRREA